MSKGKFAQTLLDMTESARTQRMQEQGYSRGLWRGGKSVADGPFYTPDESAAKAFAQRHGEDADVREYALKLGKSLDFSKDFSTGEMQPIVEALKAKKMGKLANEIADLPDDWGGTMPSGMLYQVLDKQTGGNAVEILREAGFDTINAGQEVIALHKKGLIRDANKAKFDPQKSESSDPFAAVLPAAIGIGAATQNKDAQAAFREPKGEFAKQLLAKWIAANPVGALAQAEFFAKDVGSIQAPKHQWAVDAARWFQKYNDLRKKHLHPAVDMALPVGELPAELMEKVGYGEKVTYTDAMKAELGLL